MYPGILTDTTSVFRNAQAVKQQCVRAIRSKAESFRQPCKYVEPCVCMCVHVCACVCMNVNEQMFK